jgi:2,3-bisphosphoglycerate-independent phosphoglycerate mutase
VFLDGVGLGPEDPATNPLAALPLPAFERLAGGQTWTSEASPLRTPRQVFVPLDATLGVEGLPQSGTGQATLFTGVNCASLAGRHWGPFPHTTSLPVIAASSVFARLETEGRRGQFLNAYPDRFFRIAAHRERWTVTTRCAIEAGVPLRTEADLRAGRALAADLTAEGWRTQLGLDVEPITLRQAADRFVRLGADADLSLFEFFHTDKAGHAQDRGMAEALLRALDAFFAALLDALDPSRDLLVVTSDHGNLEDLSTRTHTRHPVPLAAWGAGAEALASAETLADVVPALLAPR